MKLCNGCGQTKPLEEFNRKRAGHQSRCKVCTRSAGKSHYDLNKEYYVEKARIRGAEKLEEARAFILEYLLSHPCDCGEADPVALDFDHLDSTTKTSCVGTMARNGYSLDRIKEEIEKCIVRCANCHRKRTAKQFDWWMVRYAPVPPLASDQSLKA